MKYLENKWLKTTRSGKNVTILEIHNNRIFGRVEDDYKSWDLNGNEYEGMRGAANDLILNTKENIEKLEAIKKLESQREFIIFELNKLYREL